MNSKHQEHRRREEKAGLEREDPKITAKCR